jgi:hydroxymethylpyrimidine pyrophosphatase-like HAD family hydrolase
MTQTPAPFPQLFVTDLDDTALGGGYQPYARFPDPFSEFLDRLAARGCQWAVNTTWGADGQWQVVQSSAVRSRPSYLIAEYGLRVAQITANGPEFVQPYTASMEARVEEINQTVLFPLMRDIVARFKPARMHFYGHVFEFYPRPDEQDRLAEYVQKTYADNAVVSAGVGRALGVCPRFLEKGNGLREVLRLTGIPAERVVVAGDSMGDWSMMSADLAAHIVCPGNADPRVQAAALTRGAVGEDKASRGILQAFDQLARRHGWEY